MTKERRLGRGLEALLGQLPGWNGATPPAQPSNRRRHPSAATQADPQRRAGHDSHSTAARIAASPRGPDSASPRGRHLVGRSPSVLEDARSRPAEAPDRSIQHNPHQPRQDFDADELQRLADSITLAWALAARGRSALGRRLSAHRRRASPACRPPGRLERSAGDDRRGRRTSNGRVGHRREPAAEGPQRPGEGRLLPALPGPIWRHPGGTGRAAEARSLDDRQPDSSAGAARCGAGCPSPRQDHARPRRGPCCRWARSASK